MEGEEEQIRIDCQRTIHDTHRLQCSISSDEYQVIDILVHHTSIYSMSNQALDILATRFSRTLHYSTLEPLKAIPKAARSQGA
eukprot:766977-Hanusia_phi.AAC.2